MAKFQMELQKITRQIIEVECENESEAFFKVENKEFIFVG